MTLTRARILTPALLVAALALAGCSGSSSNDADGGSGGDSSVAGSAPKAAPDGDFSGEALEGVADSAAQPAKEDATGTDTTVAPEQSLIRTGDVALRADDVGNAQRQVQKVVDRYSGQVSDEDTQSDDDGRATFTRMVLRIPTADFDKAVAELKRAGDKLESAKTNQVDVTSQVIDVRTRVSVQKRSIARITVLFQQARSIRDIMAIEAELSQRQADLEALEQQSAHLASQTSMSTIVVSIDEIPTDKPAPQDKTDDAGFLAGLSAGWGALATFAVGLATVAGAALPWLVVVAIIGFPTLLLVRSLRRRTPAADAPQPSE